MGNPNTEIQPGLRNQLKLGTPFRWDFIFIFVVVFCLSEVLLRIPVSLLKLLIYCLSTSLSSLLQYKFLEGRTIPLLIFSSLELNRAQPTELTGGLKKKKANKPTDPYYTTQSVLKQTFSRCFRSQRGKQPRHHHGSQEGSEEIL